MRRASRCCSAMAVSAPVFPRPVVMRYVADDAMIGPGSYMEVMKVLPKLLESKDGGPSFHVVAPSLPNYGFSDEITKSGFGIRHYAEAIHQLMITLGYDKYGTSLHPRHLRSSLTPRSNPRRRLGLRCDSHGRIPVPRTLSGLPLQLYSNVESPFLDTEPSPNHQARHHALLRGREGRHRADKVGAG